MNDPNDVIKLAAVLDNLAKEFQDAWHPFKKMRRALPRDFRTGGYYPGDVDDFRRLEKAIHAIHAITTSSLEPRPKEDRDW
jgi:hypothetical protein